MQSFQNAWESPADNNMECLKLVKIRLEAQLGRAVNTERRHDPAIPSLGIYPEETKTERHMYPDIHCSIIYNS